MKESLEILQSRLLVVINVNNLFVEMIEELTSERDQLVKTNKELQDLVSQAKGGGSESTEQLLHMKRFVIMMNNDSLQLDEILSTWNVTGDIYGLEYNGITKISKVIDTSEKGKNKVHAQTNNPSKN